MKLKVKFEGGQLTVFRDGQAAQPTASKVGCEKKVMVPFITVTLYHDGLGGMGQISFQSPEWELEAVVPPDVEDIVTAHIPV